MIILLFGEDFHAGLPSSEMLSVGKAAGLTGLT